MNREESIGPLLPSIICPVAFVALPVATVNPQRAHHAETLSAFPIMRDGISAQKVPWSHGEGGPQSRDHREKRVRRPLSRGFLHERGSCSPTVRVRAAKRNPLLGWTQKWRLKKRVQRRFSAGGLGVSPKKTLWAGGWDRRSTIVYGMGGFPGRSGKSEGSRAESLFWGRC